MEDGLGSRLLETRNEDQQQRKKSSSLRFSVIFGSVLIIAVCVSAILLQTTLVEVRTDADETPKRVSRGPSLGVSEKAVGNSLKPYQWTNAELQWQRTAYHFQPEKNWMNDPNGPLVYKGWYHLFYQYNPDAAVWGNITWGHAVSKDLVHWKLLGLAMVPDHWYDINGVWTGSATFLPNGEIIMLYTGSTNESVQVQNLAVPKNLSDPLLIEWVKSPANPVLTPPKGIGYKDFRDPTTGWTGPDGAWRIAIGSKIGTTGIVLVYKTEDFINYELDGNMHGVPGTGMWECVDFYPIAESGSPVGLDTSVNGAGVKHVLKASLDDDKHDYYAIGTYNETSGTFTPDNPEIDVGIGLRYDYGKYYASKTFYDQEKQRRILWGWIAETDSEQADILKGWASVQTVPRAVWFDSKTRTNIIQWPVKEVESLRSNDTSLNDVVLSPGSVIQINTSNAAQLDIEIEFEFPDEEVLKNSREQLNYEDVVYNCSTSGGAESRGVLGPFGLLALADESRTEQTALYFYIAKAPNGKLQTFFCHDESRSSLASDLILGTHGSSVPVLEDEKTIKLRTLIDHSIIESYAQGGRTCITSRIYPTEAIDKAAKLFLFNNATTTIKVSNANVWKMKSALIGPFEE